MGEKWRDSLWSKRVVAMLVEIREDDQKVEDVLGLKEGRRLYLYPTKNIS